MIISVNKGVDGIVPPKNVVFKRTTIQDGETSNELEKLQTAMSKRVWSACVWKGDKRKAANFESAELCVFDFDSHIDPAQPKDLVEVLTKRLTDKNLWFVIGASKSHTPDRPGIRVAIRCKTIDNPDTYEHTQSQYAAKLLHGFKYDEVFDAARLWYPCKEILSSNTGSTILEPIPVPPAPIKPTTHLPAMTPSVIANDVAFDIVLHSDPGLLHDAWGSTHHKDYISFLQSCKIAGYPWSKVLPLNQILSRDDDKYENEYDDLAPTKITAGTLHYWAKKINEVEYKKIIDTVQGEKLYQE